MGAGELLISGSDLCWLQWFELISALRSDDVSVDKNIASLVLDLPLLLSVTIV